MLADASKRPMLSALARLIDSKLDGYNVCVAAWVKHTFVPSEITRIDMILVRNKTLCETLLMQSDLVLEIDGIHVNIAKNRYGHDRSLNLSDPEFMCHLDEVLEPFIKVSLK